MYGLAKNNKKMSKILVTGAAGFIASHIIDNLVNEHEIVGLDDLSGGFESNIHPEINFVEGSITNSFLVEKLFGENKFDYVFHLAAYAAEGLSHFIRKFNYTNNLIGSINLINESVKHNVKGFVFFSSAAVYGDIKVPYKESDNPEPYDPYGIAKYAVELDLKAARKMFGLNYIIFRAFNIYGEGQNLDDRYRNLIGVFINQIMSEKPLSIFGDGEQTRSMTYIKDIAPIVANSIKNEDAYGEIFNLGSYQSYTVNEIAFLVKKYFESENEIINLPDRKEVKHVYCDTNKSRKYFGDYPNTFLGTGIRNMIQWAKERGINEPKYFENIEIYKNLPTSWIR